eukprot:INCI4996.10.p1 GENE.INCI4996.10~~INCI4996.10.p1  ORF type:complete len:1172 (+),score=222.90 INCI4996.10:105-3620(+)
MWPPLLLQSRRSPRPPSRPSFSSCLRLLLRVAVTVALSLSAKVLPANASASAAIPLQVPAAPEIVLSSPQNGEVLEATTVVIKIELRDFVMPLLGRRLCIGLASRDPDWRKEVCLDELLNGGLLSIDGLLLGADYTLRVLLEDSGHVAATAMRFFSVGVVDVPALPRDVDERLVSSGRLVGVGSPVPGAGSGPAATATFAHPRAMSIEDALLLGTQLLWGNAEDVQHAAAGHHVWVAPSSAHNNHVADNRGDKLRSGDPNHLWNDREHEERDGGSESASSFAGSNDYSQPYRQYAHAVFQAVRAAKPSQSDAAHGIAISHLHAGEYRQCIAILEDELDDVSLRKAAAVRAFEMLREQQRQNDPFFGGDAADGADDRGGERSAVTGAQRAGQGATSTQRETEEDVDIFDDSADDGFDAFSDDDFEAWLLGTDDVDQFENEESADDDSDDDALRRSANSEHRSPPVATALNEVDRVALRVARERGEHELRNTLGECLRQSGAFIEAAQQYRASIDVAPQRYCAAKSNLALVLESLSELEEALSQYSAARDCVRSENEELREVSPDGGMARDNTNRGIDDDIELVSAPGNAPASAAYTNRLGEQATAQECMLMARMAQFEKAQRCLDTALQAHPESALLHNVYGVILMDQAEWSQALQHLERAVANGYSHALLNVATIFEIQGSLDEAAALFQRAYSSLKDDAQAGAYLRVKSALIVPKIMRSMNETATVRSRLAGVLKTLINQRAPLQIDDPLNAGLTKGFYLAYHGLSNLNLKTQIAKLYTRATPSLSYVAPAIAHGAGRGSSGGSGNRIFVGFVSRFFYRHSILKLMEGMIARLPRSRFYVVIFVVAPPSDAEIHHLRLVADEVVPLPQDLASCRERIQAWSLDVLVYPEIGMDPVAFFLAFARLAPVQAVWWGHPDTTGIPTIDYFISSDVEVPEAQNFYTEKLIRLKGLGTYFERPAVPRLWTNASFASQLRFNLRVPSDANLYFCAQSLFKFHVHFDAAIRGILERDREGFVVMLKGRHPSWLRQLQQRLRGSLGDLLYSRILFIPRMKSNQLMQHVAGATLMLDPFPFGGGVTSMEGFSLGVPIVTLGSSKFLRGRLTLAMYRDMDIWDCVADNVSQYIDIAVSIGTNKTLRAHLHKRILDRSDRIFEDQRAVQQWEEFLVNASTIR